MKGKTDHHKSCLAERKIGIEILRGKYTQIWRIKMKKFAFKTKGKKKKGKGRSVGGGEITLYKARLKFFITI